MRTFVLAALAVVLAAGTAAAAPAYPVSIAHKYGSTTLNKVPQRVVTLGMTDQDSFIALGTVPVATREWFGNVPGALFPWAKPLAGSAPLPKVLKFELDFEAIAALNPDVIVALAAALSKEEYETLSRIAPTVAQPADVADWAISWQASTRTAGQVLGKAAEAEKLIAGVEKKFADVRKAHPAFAGKKAQVLSSWGWPSTYYAYSSQDARGRLMAGLGFAPVAALDKLAGTSFGASVSRERLDLVDLDLVIWMTSSPDEEKALRTDPAYTKLRVAREGRDFFLPENHPAYAAFNFASVLSLPYALDALASAFDKLLDGNPATR